jgi:hypothetical protein
LTTINLHVAAIASAHSIAQQPFDRSCIKDDIKGIRREHPRKKRQARPLVADDLKAILAGFGSDARAARDRLLFTLGFAAALRRTELVGLDWQEHGAGTGYIVKDDRGLVITLLNTNCKGEPEEVIIPCADMPTACMHLLHGQPWRTCNRASRSSAAPRRGRSAAIAALIVRRRFAPVPRGWPQRGRCGCPGGVLQRSQSARRVLHCIAMAGIPEWKARRRSRHRSLATFASYVRAAEDWTDSGLKEVGF